MNAQEAVTYFVRYRGVPQPQDDFVAYYRERHAQILLEWPGIIRLVLHVPTSWNDPFPVEPDGTDFLAELTFANDDALATALVTMGEVGEATQHFRKVLELSPDLNDARLKLATIFALQGNLQQAVSLYEQALEREPDDAKIHSKLGEALAAQGRLESAVQAFRKALQLRPNDPEFHENLGRALAELCVGGGREQQTGGGHHEESSRHRGSPYQVVGL